LKQELKETENRVREDLNAIVKNVEERGSKRHAELLSRVDKASHLHSQAIEKNLDKQAQLGERLDKLRKGIG